MIRSMWTQKISTKQLFLTHELTVYMNNMSSEDKRITVEKKT